MADETKAGTAAAPSFGEAMGELEAILERIEGEEVDVDRLAEELRRAAELLDLCRAKIRRAETEVTAVVQRLEDDGDGDEDDAAAESEAPKAAGSGDEAGESAAGSGPLDDDDLPF